MLLTISYSKNMELWPLFVLLLCVHSKKRVDMSPVAAMWETASPMSTAGSSESEKSQKVRTDRFF